MFFRAKAFFLVMLFFISSSSSKLFSASNTPDEVAMYGQAALGQIQTLRDVVNARANYFASPSDVPLVLTYLSDAQKNLQLFIDDSQTAEIGWFLVEEIAKTIGTVGTDVWAGNDISRYLSDFASFADGTRVWSTSFCIEVRRCIFDKLLKVLRLIPLTSPSARLQGPALLAGQQHLRAPGDGWKRPERASSWKKMSGTAKAAVIGSCVGVAVIGSVYLFFLWGERHRG